MMTDLKTNDPRTAEFDTLVAVVCDEYRLDPERVVSKRRTHDVTTAKNIIGAIWSEHNKYEDTARRLHWDSPAAIYAARKRVAQLLDDPRHAARIARIFQRLAEASPWLMVEPEPAKTQQIQD